MLNQQEGELQVCKYGFSWTLLAAFNVGGDSAHGLLHTVHGGLGMYVVVLLILYIYFKGLGLGLF